VGLIAVGCDTNAADSIRLVAPRNISDANIILLVKLLQRFILVHPD
jgi:hypothetical protein